MYKPCCVRYMLNSKAFRYDFRLQKVMQLEDFPGDGRLYDTTSRADKK